ncbi:YbeF family protein [Bacillus zhangzhouensis]|nr:YbeF family protein [Bacillus zhangzhouensis]
MGLVLFTLPLLYLAWGIIGYLIFKRIRVVLIITFVTSTIFIFAYTGLEISNMYWVAIVTFLCMCTSVMTKIIRDIYIRYKKA